LAKAAEKLADRHHAVLLASHGPVVAGASLADAQYASEELGNGQAVPDAALPADPPADAGAGRGTAGEAQFEVESCTQDLLVAYRSG
jgi:hypothetical protein